MDTPTLIDRVRARARDEARCLVEITNLRRELTGRDSLTPHDRDTLERLAFSALVRMARETATSMRDSVTR